MCLFLIQFCRAGQRHLKLSDGNLSRLRVTCLFLPPHLHTPVHTHIPHPSFSPLSPGDFLWGHQSVLLILSISFLSLYLVIIFLHSLYADICTFCFFLLFSSLSFSFEVSQSQQAHHASPLISAPLPPSPVPRDARHHFRVDLTDRRGPKQAVSGPDPALASSARDFYL